MLHRFIRMACLFVLPAILLAGCTPNDQDKFVVKNQLDNIRDEIKLLKTQIDDLSVEKAALEEQVESLRAQRTAAASPDPAMLQGIEKRFQALEQAQQGMADSVKTLSQKVDEQQTAIVKAATPVKVAAVTPPTPPQKSAPKSAGFYYTVQKGETVEMIAKKHQVSEAALRKANHIPDSSNVVGGQRIFVP
ncbi:LysM peptidoglycan-binding domain-containing protein [Candidatus Sumerlaeota bacterium]|nr:LysM peptidoglycan-binding domain-containing protein [Candidatus Sumerlaeota bacterium]